MKTLVLFALFASMFAFTAPAQAANGYTCKSFGDRACAVSNRTGQCTQEWKRKDGGDPMYFCRVFTGEISNRVDRRNYQCSGDRDRACARSRITGQCTLEWSSRDGGGDAMYSCRRWMGEVPNHVDRSNYTCSGDSDRVCARDIRTGQCTHVWSRRDGGDPWFQCRNWLSK